MKLISIFFSILFIYSSSLYAKENDWTLDRFNFYFEDDVLSHTDDEYSAGGKLTLLYFIEDENYPLYDILFLDVGDTYSYFSASIVSQMYTPTQVHLTQNITYDRPYAGWTYLETSMHKSSKNHLRSLSLKLGIIGPSAGAESLQNNFHSLIGVAHVLGWENQLEDELGVSLLYTHKYHYAPKPLFDVIESAFVPFASAELGNIAVQATAGIGMRVGYNIPKDYGVSSIDIGAEPGVPIYGAYQDMKKLNWSFSLNAFVAGSIVGHDIFLDGNTFANSDSVEKELLTGYYAYGLTARYKSFVFDFIQIHNSKKFKLETKGHSVGTFVFSWLY